MHILFEGVLQLEVRLMLGSFLDKKLFTLDTLNDRVKNFVYGRMEASNKPPKSFEKAHFNSRLHLSGMFV